MTSARRRERPEWWDWELAFTAHVELRMEERGFTEVDVRGMLEGAGEDLEPSRKEGRWIVQARYHGVGWIIVLEPDHRRQLLYVVTAYPLRVEP